MKSKWKEIVCYFVVILVLVKCDYFSIVGSAILRVDEAYKAAVTSHNVEGEVLDVIVGIQGISNNGESVNLVQEISLDPGSTKMVKFQLNNLTIGSYRLIAECQNFSKSIGLYVNPQKVTLLIQLDKPIYKTSDVVKFRIFAIDSRTKPYKVAQYSRILILDPRNNELRKWENVKFIMGIYEDNFEFSRLPPGVYEVIAEVDETIVSKKFEIFQESQQIYDIKLSVPERILFSDGTANVKISIGFPTRNDLENFQIISGKLTLLCDQRKVVKYQRISNATNYEIFEHIDFISDLGLEFIDDRKTYELKVIFTDDITKKNYTTTSKFTIEMSDFDIQIVHSPKYFKIGIPYSFTILVTKAVDQVPVQNSNEPIYVVIKDDRNDTLVDEDFQLDSITGSVEIRTPEIPEDTNFLEIYAKYDKIQYFQQINLSKTQQSESIAIDVLTPRPKMYEQVHFEVETTSQSVSFAVFQLFAKGLLKISKLVRFEDGHAMFSIIPKFSYTPKAHCMIYFINNNGGLVSDTITLHFDNQFPNFVHLDVDSTATISPNSNFSLNVTSTLNSIVSLLAVDQRSISQRFKHDILKDFIFDTELTKYDRAAVENFYDIEIPFWFYPLSYQKSFFDIGAVILTNAVQDIPCRPDKTETSIFDKISNDSDQPITVKRSSSDETRYFDGFLFETILIDEQVDEAGIKGQKFFSTKLPDISTTWAFTAITLSEQYGLGLTSEPFMLDSYKKFFIEFSVPAVLKVGEIVLIEILIGNLYETELSATVEIPSNNNQGFEISRPWTYEWVESQKGFGQKIQVPPENVRRLLVEVSAVAFGNFDFQVIATSTKGIEEKISTIEIIPEGFSTQNVQSRFVAAQNCYSKVSRTLKCELEQENFIENSLTVHATVYGDVMGLTLANLDRLSSKLTGNAEEILLVFALNVLTLDYLVLTDQLSSPLKIKAVYYLKQNYQNLIKYRNMDGSFSSFIQTPNEKGSLLLTANVCRYMRRAQRYIKINEDILLEALIFIVSQQQQCGKFPKDQNSTTQTDVSFTALVGILIDENTKFYPQYNSVVQKAIEYVELHYDKNNLYSLALVTHFMYEVDSHLKYRLLQSLLSYIQDIPSIDVNAKGFASFAFDVEIVSYCLMILDHIPQLYHEAFKIVQLLVTQQQINGKFVTNSDTIIALEAISRFASRFPDKNENLEIVMLANGGDDYVEHAEITRATKLTKQQFLLPPTIRQLDISADGDGFAVVQLSCNYYINSVKTSYVIKLSAQFRQDSCVDYLILAIDLELTLTEISDIIIVSVESPSGFVYDSNDSAFPSYIMNIEELNRGTLLHIYLKDFDRKLSFYLKFLKKFIIFNTVSSNIEVYDFYNHTIKTSEFYEIPNDLPSCSNHTSSTSPPVYDFTTLEPLPVEFSRHTTENAEHDKNTEENSYGTEEETVDEDNLDDDEFTTDSSVDSEPEDQNNDENLDENSESKSADLNSEIDETLVDENIETDDQASISTKEPINELEEIDDSESETDIDGKALEEASNLEDYSQDSESINSVDSSDYEESSTAKIFPSEKDAIVDDLDSSQDYLETSEEAVIEEEFETSTKFVDETTVEQAVKPSIANKKENFRKKLNKIGLPKSMRNKKLPSRLKIPKFPQKGRKTSKSK